VDAITDHLPLRRPRGRIRDVLGGFGVVNGLLVTAVLGAAIASYFVIAGTAQPTAQVRTATVARGVVLATISATGALQAAQGLNVDFATSGKITAVGVRTGEHVKRGQILGRIDATSARQGVQQAEAALRSARASLATTHGGRDRAWGANTRPVSRQGC
jgi:membrane fusion protein, macrolide-specific efflux system